MKKKRTHDSQELFDNVHSLHDAKSAVLIAKLQAMGLSMQWQPPTPSRVRLRALVELRQHEQSREEICQGRLEAMLARHWPEFGRWMDVREQKSALSLLITYPTPASVAAEPEQVKQLLRAASHGRLSKEAMEGVIKDAQRSLGLPALPENELVMRTLATQQYPTARQLEKACGMILREKSSGQTKGQLSISKRRPGLVRKVMYLFALRMIQANEIVRAWYMRRKGYTEGSKQRAVVAVMRKLTRAMFHIAKGNAFDASKLFDVRRLDLDSTKAVAEEARVVAPTTTSATAKETTETESKATSSEETSVAASQVTATTGTMERTASQETTVATAKQTSPTLVDLRSAVENTYGPIGLGLFRFDGAVQQDPQVLLTSGQATHAALVDPSVTLPSPRRKSLSLDRQAFAQELEQDLDNLDKALAVVAREGIGAGMLFDLAAQAADEIVESPTIVFSATRIEFLQQFLP